MGIRCCSCDETIKKDDRAIHLSEGTRILANYHEDCFVEEIFEKAMQLQKNKGE